ncbi:hypothetical protein [Legionella sp. km772]|uniref:hypothetical protein n=1 Tax=Legionella sp. km772 TaxID=2498111 RepID=UPI000FB1AE59|nr:hypothetical protein [Legionella sp. km772]RUR10689.1 hypothetical protein ELY15_07820 [Legionella sp. km772]
MRALDKHRATDEAILSFVSLLNEFYSQCSSKPSQEELDEYTRIMKLITARINLSEVAHFTQQYLDDGEQAEVVKSLASAQALQTFNAIPTRMQYWAAGERWGDPIRNAAAHSQAVKHMEKWWNWLHPVRHYDFFPAANSSTATEPHLSEVAKKLEF